MDGCFDKERGGFMITFEFCCFLFAFSFLQGISMVFLERLCGVIGVHVWRKAKSRECARIKCKVW